MTYDPHHDAPDHPPSSAPTVAGLAVDDPGRADGPVVLFLHSAPGSRRFDPDPAATAAAGVRLLTVDRPGYGESHRVAEGRPPEAAPADDLAAVLAALGVTEAAVVGWSAGGRVALALAARHPELVRAVGVVGTPAPDDEVPWVPDGTSTPSRWREPEPETAMATVAAALRLAAADGDGPLATVAAGPATRSPSPTPSSALGWWPCWPRPSRRAGRSGHRHRRRPGRAVGLRPRPRSPPSSLFYGAADVVVPPAHGEYWVTVIPATDLHVVPGAGHLVVASAWGDALAAVR